MMNVNLRYWDVLGKTDPKHTKGFKRAGGFSGTAIKPIYTVEKMTETFGPCGVGWIIGKPEFQVVAGDNREQLVFCTVSLQYKDGTNLSGEIWGIGGDKIVTHIKANEQYKRPERWENDDEAFKKAYTDALSNAMKQLGMSADVHMGLFDDNKYVAQMRHEFAEEPVPPPNPAGNKTRTPAPTTETPFDDTPDPIPVQPQPDGKGSDWSGWMDTILTNLRKCENEAAMDQIMGANRAAAKSLEQEDGAGFDAMLQSIKSIRQDVGKRTSRA